MLWTARPTWQEGMDHTSSSAGEKIYKLTREIRMVDEKKFICSFDSMLSVFQAQCQEGGCTNATKVKHHFIGTTLVLTSSFLSGHTFQFCSSHDVNGIYASNLQILASIIFSGNNFTEFARLGDFCGLVFLSSLTYNQIQSLEIHACSNPSQLQTKANDLLS